MRFRVGMALRLRPHLPPHPPTIHADPMIALIRLWPPAGNLVGTATLDSLPGPPAWRYSSACGWLDPEDRRRAAARLLGSEG